MNKQLPILILLSLALSSCSSFDRFNQLTDRSPDYRQSNLSRKIEVPPDLSNASLNSGMAIADLSPESIASYNQYQENRVQIDERGYIAVLPELYRVQIIENTELPYIETDANPEQTWQIIKRYWQDNGVRLAVDNPQIGIMETDWLENQAGRPKSGVGGLLSNLLGFLRDSDQRDRYRIRLSRNNTGGSEINLIYTQSELVEQERIGLPAESAGYTWRINDNQNPELQLEMIRRIALYLSDELQKADNVQSAIEEKTPTAEPSVRLGQGLLTTLNNQQPALILYGNYRQSYRVLNIALDRASFRIENNNPQTGSIEVLYDPPRAEERRNFLTRLWKRTPQTNEEPRYLVRISDQGDHSIVIIQNTNQQNLPQEQAQIILEHIYQAL